MKIQAIIVALITIITAPTNLFSALQDFNLDKKFPRETVTLTISTKSKKTTWEKVQENKLHTTIGAYTGIIALLAPIAIAERNYNDVKQRQNLAYSCAGVIILAGLSYYLLQPLFNDETSDTPQEQNNNQH